MRRLAFLSAFLCLGLGMISSGSAARKDFKLETFPVFLRVPIPIDGNPENTDPDNLRWREVRVDLDSKPKSAHKRDGTLVQLYTAEQGFQIAGALEDEGVRDPRIIAGHLLGVTSPANRVPGGRGDQSVGPSGPEHYALFVRLQPSGPAVFRADLKGGYENFVRDFDTGRKIFRPSVADCVRVYRAAAKSGYGWQETAGVCLGMTLADTTSVRREEPEVPCGECRTGGMDCLRECPCDLNKNDGKHYGCQICSFCYPNDS